jgi:cytoskeleton protein RodZ
MSLSPPEGEAPSRAAVVPPGARLRAAREAQGMTPEEAATALKLSLRQLASLEGGRHDELPGPVFVRGFIRNYARLVKLDAVNLLEQVAAPAKDAAIERPRRRMEEIPFPGQGAGRWRRYVAAAVAVLLPLLVYEAYFRSPPEPSIVEKPVVSAPVETRPVAAAAGSADAGFAPAEGGVATEPQSAFHADASAPAPPASQAYGSVQRTARLAFERESWVEIRDRDGAIIHSRLHPAGSEQSIDLPAIPLSFVVGNAASVTMSIDGKPVDLQPHIRVTVARFLVER